MLTASKSKAQLICELSGINFNELDPPAAIQTAIFSSIEKFSNAFQNNPNPLTITTLGEGRYVDVNKAFLALSGYQRHEVIDHTVFDLDIWVSSEERDYFIKKLREKGYICRNEEIDCRNQSGQTIKFLFSTEIIYINEHPHLLWVINNIIDRRKTEKARLLSADPFFKTFNASPFPMSITSLMDGRIIAFNNAFSRVLGCERDKIVGRTSWEIGFCINPQNRTLIKETILANKSVREMEIEFMRQDGEKRLGHFSAEAIDIDGKPCILVTVADITEKRQAELKIKYLSFHDKLTGLYNRAFLEDILKCMNTENIVPVSLIMGDVNGLKSINDVLGHREGDQLLIAVADLLLATCRKQDIVARWGSDEFVVLLPDCDFETASQILGQIKLGSKKLNNLPIDASISLGMASKMSNVQDLREILKEAEDKMYRHKLLEDKSTRSSFLNSLENTLWARSHETEEHCRRMQEMTLKLGQAINLPESELDNLRLLATLHDIGKIAISNSILENPGKLTMEEWESMRKHPEIGYRIALGSPDMAPIAEAILYHHEHWDGTGYPLGIKGENIPVLSRILTIVDCYDVMINGRPYQKPVSPKAACNELARCSESHFDPHLVNIAIKVFSEMGI